MVTSASEAELLSIKPAHRDDAPELAGIHCAAALAAYARIFPSDAPKPTPESLLAGWRALIDRADATVFVASIDNTAVAAVALVSDDDVPARLLLGRLYVGPLRWRAGIGSALLDHALAQARRGGAARINLWVLEDNERARAMYERRGWQLVAGRTLANDPPSVIDVMYERELR